MIRACPKCGAYYADAALGFCLRDGTPLTSIDPSDSNWTEATRSVDHQQRALRKMQRKVRWRRLFMTGMTTLVVTVVVCVVAVNGLIYLAPKDEGTGGAVVASTAPGAVGETILLNADSSPTPVVETPTPGFTPSVAASPESSVLPSPSPSVKLVETVTPTPTPTPTPIVVHRITGRVTAGGQPLASVKVSLEGTMLTSTTTDGNGYYNFNGLPEGGTYFITPKGQTNFSPSNHSFSNLRQDSSADFSAPVSPPPPPPPQVCTDDDKVRLREELLNRLGAEWRRGIESEKPRIIADSLPRAPAGEPGRGEVSARLGSIDFDFAFFRTCRAVLVTARYTWQVHVSGNAIAPEKNLTIPKRRSFQCAKLGSMWICN